MSTVGKRSDGPFEWPTITDERVNPSLRMCLFCHEQPIEPFTSADGDVMLMAAQCSGCGRVYILGGMTTKDTEQ